MVRTLGIAEKFLNFPRGLPHRIGQPPHRGLLVGATGFRGVRISHERYEVRINSEGKKINLGYFNTAEEAARTFDTKARELGRPEASLNFPQGGQTQSAVAATSIPAAAAERAAASSRGHVRIRPNRCRHYQAQPLCQRGRIGGG